MPIFTFGFSAFTSLYSVEDKAVDVVAAPISAAQSAAGSMFLPARLIGKVLGPFVG
jgi:hypothetical protein